MASTENKEFVFTSESVTEGHPDKIADQISDGVLDAVMAEDPNGRVACETACTTGLVLVMGEITTQCYVDIPKIARNTIRDIGYTRAKYGFDCDTCAVITSIDEQSADIDMGVSNALEAKEGKMKDSEIEAIGAGDQGMMFGYACDETPELMPMPISMAHKLCMKMSEMRRKKVMPYLRPDGKSQVTVRYSDGKPVEILTVLVSNQHDLKVEQKQIMDDVKKHVVPAVIPKELLTKNTRYLVNPTGRFAIGGPQGDSGLTGRKIIVDTYGGYARHGGGAFSGKDPTKVDRSGAYMARYIAKNIVAAGLAAKCEIQVAYAIGVARPLSVLVSTFGTGKIASEKILKLIDEHFDLRPAAIIRDLNLRRPIYRKTAAYGHFGRELDEFTWERIDKAEILKKDAKKL